MFDSVKIMGERNSGTNFVAKAINLNCVVHLHQSSLPAREPIKAEIAALGSEELRTARTEAELDRLHSAARDVNGGWKHAMLDAAHVARFSQGRNVVFLCITRHPANWLRSTLRVPFHAGTPMPLDMPAFIRAAWKTQARDEMGGETLANPMALWSRKTAAFLDCQARFPNVKVLRYEDFVLRFDEMIHALGFDLRRGGDLLIPQTHARSFIKDDARFEDYQARVADDPWRDYAPEDAAYVRSQLDAGVMGALGYT